MCCRGNTLSSVGLGRLCKCLLDLPLCLGLGISAGPTGQGSLSLLLIPHISPCVWWSSTALAVPMLSLRPGWGSELWGESGRLRAELELLQTRAGVHVGFGLWTLGCPSPSSAICLDFQLLAACFQRVGLTKHSFTVYIFFLLVMQCSGSLDVLFLLDGSYSIGKGSFERSKHFAGKLCDALDIHPDRVSVRNISSNFQTAWQCV